MAQGIPTYNWIEEKQKFFDSDCLTAKDFLVRFLSIDPKTASGGSFGVATKGWTREKKEYLNKISTKSQEKTINNPDVQKQASQLVLAMSNIEKKVANLLGGKTEFGIDDLPKVKVGYEMLRLATGQSTQNQGGDKNNPIQTETTHNLSNLGVDDLKTLQDIIKKTLE